MRLHPPARHGRDHHRRPAKLLAALLMACVGALPSSASADPDDAQALQAPVDLVERGLGQSRGVPIPVPPGAPRLRADDAPKFAMQGRVFVNFDGAQLSDGWDDSTTDTTQISECAGNFAAYGNGAKRDAALQAVRDDWAAYNVIITDTRPGSGNYTMCMTGPTNPFGGGVLGIAPLDCDDSQTPNNIVYAFHSVDDQFDASTQATTIGQEVAHSYGLEHVDEPGDVMNPYNAGGDPSFTDVCIGVVGGVVCGAQHAAECGSQSSQNSHRELLTLFGPSTPDNSSPTVAITAPEDGDSFEEGATFEILVDASDDVAIDHVVLYNNGDEIESDGAPPYGWTVNNAPAGSYAFYVEAIDSSGNVSMSGTVTVSVGGVAADSGDGEDDDGDDSAADSAGDAQGDGGDSANDGGDDGTEGGGEDGAFDDGADGSLPPGYGLDGETPQSCACTSTRDGLRPSWMVSAIVLLGLVRPRRNRARSDRAIR